MKLPKGRRGAAWDAFTLIEVMIAITIFFMAMFAILGVLASGVRAATLLRNNGPSAGMVAAQLSATNKLEEGSQSGTFEDIGVYKDYRWAADLREVATNGLFQVDIAVLDGGGSQVSTLSVLLYRPDSGNGNTMGLHPSH
jgi:Tfp pilus assembly protein PilV